MARVGYNVVSREPVRVMFAQSADTSTAVQITTLRDGTTQREDLPQDVKLETIVKEVYANVPM
jgi:hypothetical protein